MTIRVRDVVEMKEKEYIPLGTMLNTEVMGYNQAIKEYGDKEITKEMLLKALAKYEK